MAFILNIDNEKKYLRYLKQRYGKERARDFLKSKK